MTAEIYKELIKEAEGPTYIHVRTRIALCILAVTRIRINELLPFYNFQIMSVSFSVTPSNVQQTSIFNSSFKNSGINNFGNLKLFLIKLI